MFNKLEAVASRYEQIAAELSQPQTVADTELFTKLMKEHAALSPIVEKYREYVSAQQAEKEALQIIAENGGDKELKELAEEELKEAKANLERSVMGFTIMESFMDELKVESIEGMGTKVSMKKYIQVSKEEENKG